MLHTFDHFGAKGGNDPDPDAFEYPRSRLIIELCFLIGVNSYLSKGLLVLSWELFIRIVLLYGPSLLPLFRVFAAVRRRDFSSPTEALPTLVSFGAERTHSLPARVFCTVLLTKLDATMGFHALQSAQHHLPQFEQG